MQQSTSRFFLATPPEHKSAATAYKLPLAHMAYRLGTGPHLYRAGTNAAPRGGLMLVCEDRFDGQGDASIFCRELLRECQNRGYGGVILDLDSTPTPTLARIITSLGEQLSARSMAYYLPESYGNYSKHATLMLSSAISGGSLKRRLSDACTRYGAARILLCLDRSAEDFYLPSPQGSGRALSRDELKGRIETLGPSVFFSTELCAHYFTYMSRESGAHFVLFDDVGSLRKKVTIAESLGITQFLLCYPDVDDLLPALFGTR